MRTVWEILGNILVIVCLVLSVVLTQAGQDIESIRMLLVAILLLNLLKD